VRRALVAAAGLALALPAAAHATDYGGGTAPDSVARANRQLTLVALRTFDDGSARVAAKVAAGCGVVAARRTVRPAADGTFSFTATVRRSTGGVRQISRVALSGQVAGGLAAGTVGARVTFRRGGRVVARCNSGSRAWNARTAGATTATGAAYYGLTDQTGRPFPFVLSVGGSRVRVAAFEYRMRCRNGGFEWENITPGGRTAQDGSFALRERFTRRWREGRETFRVKVDGRVTTTAVSGALSVSSVLRSPSGRVIDRCTTGRRTFAATP
jgi:hypothetical protein